MFGTAGNAREGHRKAHVMSISARFFGAAVVAVLLSAPLSLRVASASAVPPCTAKQLTIADVGTHTVGNRAVTKIDIVNNSATTCSISGYPRLEFQRFSGAIAPVNRTQTASDANYKTPGPSTVSVASLGHANFLLGYPRVDAHSNTCAPISTIIVGGFAGGGTLKLPDSIAPCTSVNVSPFFVPEAK